MFLLSIRTCSHFHQGYLIQHLRARPHRAILCKFCKSNHSDNSQNVQHFRARPHRAILCKFCKLNYSDNSQMSPGQGPIYTSILKCLWSVDEHNFNSPWDDIVTLWLCEHEGAGKKRVRVCVSGGMGGCGKCVFIQMMCDMSYCRQRVMLSNMIGVIAIKGFMWGTHVGLRSAKVNFELDP